MTADTAARAAALRNVPLLAELRDAVVQRLAELSQVVEVRPGAVLMREGEEANGLFVLLDGRLEVTKRVGMDDLPVGGVGPGEVVGEMALLEQGGRTATVKAVEAGSALFISRGAFREMLANEPLAALALVQTLAGRLRATQSMLQQREKLAALGTLAAGLAHELNNPAAAMRRSASLLQEAFAELGRSAQVLADTDLDGRGRAAVAALRERRAGPGGPSASPDSGTPSGPRDALAQSDLTDRLERYLDERGVPDGWQLASPLSARGWEPGRLDAVRDQVGGAAFPAVASWLAALATIDALLDEIGTASQRIGELVTAVKSYTFLDQAPVQDVDVREGLESTLVILRHKLKAGVTVVRDYAADLPRIEAYGSELNQVWTNIIDNAIDAMDGDGVLTVRAASLSDGWVQVDICDDGPGISDAVQRRMFEPFFTTKEPGIGTGLGLHIAHSIVAGHHHGRISVSSVPGATCFRVSLPGSRAER